MEKFEKEKELDRMYHQYPRSGQTGLQKAGSTNPPALWINEHVLTDDAAPSDIDFDMFSPVVRAAITKHNKDRKSIRKARSKSRSRSHRRSMSPGVNSLTRKSRGNDDLEVLNQ